MDKMYRFLVCLFLAILAVSFATAKRSPSLPTRLERMNRAISHRQMHLKSGKKGDDSDDDDDPDSAAGMPDDSASPSVSSLPSELPSFFPSSSLMPSTSSSPSEIPSHVPSVSQFPTAMPSLLPTPTASSTPSGSPTETTTSTPSGSSEQVTAPSPSPPPTATMTSSPTFISSKDNLVGQTLDPAARNPTQSPSIPPSPSPTNRPSSVPSDEPSEIPSSGPSSIPSDIPSLFPSTLQTVAGSMIPSDIPSLMPSGLPSSPSPIDPATSTPSSPSALGSPASPMSSPVDLASLVLTCDGDGAVVSSSSSSSEAATTVQVDFVYRLFVENSVPVEDVRGEVEQRMTEAVGNALLSCNRRWRGRRRLVEGIQAVSSSPPDVETGSCGTECHIMNGYMTIESDQPTSSSAIVNIFCATIQIVQDTEVLTRIATSVDGVEALLFGGTTLSCSADTTSSAANEGEINDRGGIEAANGGLNTTAASIGFVAAGVVLILVVVALAKRRRADEDDETTKVNYAIMPCDTALSSPSNERDLLIEHNDFAQSRDVAANTSAAVQERALADDITLNTTASSEATGTVAGSEAQPPPKPLPPVSDAEESDVDGDVDDGVDDDDNNEMEAVVTEKTDDNNDNLEGEKESSDEDTGHSQSDDSANLLGAKAPPSPILGDDDEDDEIEDLEALMEDAEPIDLSSMVRPPQQKKLTANTVYRPRYGTPPSMTPIKENETPSELLSQPANLFVTDESDSSVSTDEEERSDQVAQFVGGDVKLLSVKSVEGGNGSDSEGSI